MCPWYHSVTQPAAAGDPVSAGSGSSRHQVQRGASRVGAAGEGDRAGGTRLGT